MDFNIFVFSLALWSLFGFCYFHFFFSALVIWISLFSFFLWHFDHYLVFFIFVFSLALLWFAFPSFRFSLALWSLFEFPYFCFSSVLWSLFGFSFFHFSMAFWSLFGFPCFRFFFATLIIIWILLFSYFLWHFHFDHYLDIPIFVFSFTTAIGMTSFRLGALVHLVLVVVLVIFNFFSSYSITFFQIAGVAFKCHWLRATQRNFWVNQNWMDFFFSVTFELWHFHRRGEVNFSQKPLDNFFFICGSSF